MEEISLKDNGAKRKGKATVRLRGEFQKTGHFPIRLDKN